MTDKYTIELGADNLPEIYTVFFNEEKWIYRVLKYDISDMIRDDLIYLMNKAYKQGLEDGKNDG